MYGEDVLVQAKAELDKDLPKARSGDQSIIASLFEKEELLHDCNARSRGQAVTIDSHWFCMAALPFSNPFGWASKGVKVKKVDSNVVLGGKFYPHKKLDKHNAALKADELDSLADQDDKETAKYTRIGTFNLYSPNEGKNRVSLYRDLQRPIRALTRVDDYPAASNLELVMLMPDGVPALALKDCPDAFRPYVSMQFVDTSSGYVALLPIRESVGVLEKYGVKWGAARNCPEAQLAERRWLLFLAHSYYQK